MVMMVMGMVGLLRWLWGWLRGLGRMDLVKGARMHWYIVIWLILPIGGGGKVEEHLLFVILTVFTQTVVFLDSLVCPMLMMFLICDTEAFFLSLLSISLMSPIITLTKAYSMRLKKTKRVQDDINMSIALMYETGGSDF